MLGINTVIYSGVVSGSITFQETKLKKTPACSFSLVSSRRGPKNSYVSSKVKINAYGDYLYDLCSKDLDKGVYVVVQGELMNRSGQYGELTEIRAIEILFTDANMEPTDTKEYTEQESD